MDEGQLLMTQAERDRLVTLKKAKKGLMTQREAGMDLEVSERHIRRLLNRLKENGDKSVIHGLKGQPSNRGIGEEIWKRAMKALSSEKCKDFGPTYARDYLAKHHQIQVSKETVRQWMVGKNLWRAGRRKPEKKQHVWRERRSRFGELVQWDTSNHDWLEGRGSERVYLISMIDDATSRLWARFAAHDSTQENMKLLETYLRQHGRPQAFYTDKASLFQVSSKTKRGEDRTARDEKEMGPTQIGRALGELGITWIGAHSPQAKGRIERSFETAQDRLVKDLRMADVKTADQANRYLETEFLPWWNRKLAVAPREPEDAHRPLEKTHDLAAILSHVENRTVMTDYTFQFQGKKYVVERADIRTGLRGAAIRVEQRRDETIAIRFQEHYLRYRLYDGSQKAEAPQPLPGGPAPKTKRPVSKSKWMKGFLDTKGPSIGKAIAISNATS